MSVDLAAFKARAERAEAALSALEKRVAELERARGGKGGAAAAGAPNGAVLVTGADVVEAERFRSDTVSDLLAIRAAVAAQDARVKELEKERAAMAEERAKLEYRVGILLRSLEEAEAKARGK